MNRFSFFFRLIAIDIHALVSSIMFSTYLRVNVTIRKKRPLQELTRIFQQDCGRILTTMGNIAFKIWY